MGDPSVAALYAAMVLACCSLVIGLRIPAAALLLSAAATEAMNAAGVGYTPARWFAVDCLVIAAIVGPCLVQGGAVACWHNLGMRQRFILWLFGFIWASYGYPYVAYYNIGTYAMVAQLLLTLPWTTLGNRVRAAVHAQVNDHGGTFNRLSYV